MGYDLHITRAADWNENTDVQIAAEEWLSVVRGDAELSADPDNGEYAARWAGLEAGASGWFDWYEGNVFTTDPSRALLAKMLLIAERLSAVVQGDDSELYKSPQDLREPSPNP